jgi:hypothetical protein
MVIRDGDWTLVEHDAHTGRTVWSMQNPDGSTTYRTDTPVNSLVEMNTASRNMAQSGWRGDYHLVASMPSALYFDQLHEASLQKDDKFINRFLNDSDNRAWRVKEGRL